MTRNRTGFSTTCSRPNNIQSNNFNRSSSSHKTKLFILPLLLTSMTIGSVAHAARTAPVNLRRAGFFAILSESGISNVPASRVTGNVGTSPITGAADLLTCTEVHGRVVSVDAAGPAPCNRINPAMLGTAVLDMQAAYTDAASRVPTVTELGAGNIGGLTITPGVYSWSSNILIPANVTLKGGPDDVWIFQIAQNVKIASATSILLRGGANPANIFWQVAGSVTIGTYAKFEGTVLCMTHIAMRTDASIHGRLYAQTAVTLQMNAVKESKLPSRTVAAFTRGNDSLLSNVSH